MLLRIESFKYTIMNVEINSDQLYEKFDNALSFLLNCHKNNDVTLTLEGEYMELVEWETDKRDSTKRNVKKSIRLHFH